MKTSSWVQLRALFGLRWRMIRSDGVRVAMILVVIFLIWLMVLVAHGAAALDEVQLATAVEVAPQAFLGFGVLAVIAPLTAGGGNEIVPPDQLVAYPIRPRTQFLGGLVLTPLNLVWILQILALIAETAFVTRGGDASLGAITTVAYVTALTALGQALAWTVVGLRQSSRGRVVVALIGSSGLVAAVLAVKTGIGSALVDASPTRTVVHGITAGAHEDWLRWALTTAGLVALTVLGLALGERTCGWALRRPSDVGTLRAAHAVRRRPHHASALRALVAMDRASIWRAPALRRGALVLAVLPGLAAAGAQVPWQSLVVLPGLVAAGAGLLFGINAFCLDGSGAVFLASLPHDPRLIARAKTVVLTETVLASVVIAALAGSLRSRGTPTAADVTGIVASGLACTLLVVSRCMASSVRRPHKAELKGPRDAVAPPGALALASARLAISTGLLGVALGAATASGRWWAPVALATPVLLLCWLSLHRSLSMWADPVVRARIVHTVSAG
ncbi:MAG: hypothetical protein JWM02_1249 [Frankiales bacterium]|nr:hypothetical protein [Frankiales bacterium]